MILTNIYIYEMDEFHKLLEVSNFFSNYRLKKIESSNNIEVINRMIFTEYMLKHILELELNQKIEKIEIETKNINKPYLKNINKYFNISHKDNIIIIGLSNSDLGLDIEKVDHKHLKVAKRIYKENKNYKIDKIIKDFTIKESYIKYYGSTILTNMKVINISKSEVSGPEGILKYKSFKYNDYYISLSQNVDFKVNFYKVNKDFTINLINYNKYIKIHQSKEEE